MFYVRVKPDTDKDYWSNRLTAEGYARQNVLTTAWPEYWQGKVDFHAVKRDCSLPPDIEQNHWSSVQGNQPKVNPDTGDPYEVKTWDDAAEATAGWFIIRRLCCKKDCWF